MLFTGAMVRSLKLAVALALYVAVAAASPLGPDGTPGRAFPGKFIWYDLATENPEGARAFYGAVFGWKFREVPGAPASYTLIENASGKVGGLFRQARPQGATVGSRWLSLMSVRDVEKAAALVKAGGGEVLLAPRKVTGRGVHAVFRDPEGAVFGVLANEGGDPPDTPVDDGEVFWLDLFSHDPARASAFYAGLAGYDVNVGEVAGRRRTLLATDGVARAGVARLSANANKPGWLPYILVSDVPGTLARARAAGGKVVMAPRADLLGGNLAVIADPSGGLLGIVNWVSQ
jgi:predicted enzyme related to lactoylglutathione lyase